MSDATDRLSASVAKLNTDVQALANSVAAGATAAQAEVDNLASSTADQIDQIDTLVKANLPPAS